MRSNARSNSTSSVNGESFDAEINDREQIKRFKHLKSILPHKPVHKEIRPKIIKIKP